MQNKLQELTNQLYNEGLSKGKQDAEQILAQAKKDAQELISAANARANQIIEEAKKDAEELKSKVTNDLKMASIQTTSAIKQEIESTLITKSTSTPIKEALSDGVFVKSILSKIVEAFNASSTEPKPLNLILPASMQESLVSALENEVKTIMGNELNISLSKKINSGFKIGPKDGGYLISFSEGDFENIIGEYLRPATKQILFG